MESFESCPPYVAAPYISGQPSTLQPYVYMLALFPDKWAATAKENICGNIGLDALGSQYVVLPLLVHPVLTKPC